MLWRVTLFFVLLVSSACAGKSVAVFIALCDNKTQGILPVNDRIGNGDDPENNLYWGCSDGLGRYFANSKRWKRVSAEKDINAEILRRETFEHVSGDVTLVAEAYRGSAMKQCLEDFEKALASGKADLVVFIGHNGLMDGPLKEQSPPAENKADAIVLACKSDAYFTPRIERLHATPILMTRQFMYPGAFILHDAIDVWRQGKSRSEIRAAAGRAYAKNQKISVNAATGVFTDLEKAK